MILVCPKFGDILYSKIVNFEIKNLIGDGYVNYNKCEKAVGLGLEPACDNETVKKSNESSNEIASVEPGGLLEERFEWMMGSRGYVRMGVEC